MVQSMNPSCNPPMLAGAVAVQCVQKYLNLFHLEMQGIIVSCPPLAWCAAPACSFTPIHH